MTSHLPPGVINAVTGHSSIIGDEMVSSPFVNKVSFTGSVETGISISKKASMKKITLELGGNDPLVVLDDADINKAVKAAVSGAFINAGQVCIAIKRIIPVSYTHLGMAVSISKKTSSTSVIIFT